mgnify:CR=1 FL=1
MERRKVKLIVTVEYTPEVLKDTIDEKGNRIDQTYEEVTERDIAIMDQEICETVGSALDNLFDDAFDDPDREDYLLSHSDAKYSVINWSAHGQDLSK